MTAQIPRPKCCHKCITYLLNPTKDCPNMTNTVRAVEQCDTAFYRSLNVACSTGNEVIPLKDIVTQMYCMYCSRGTSAKAIPGLRFVATPIAWETHVLLSAKAMSILPNHSIDNFSSIEFLQKTEQPDGKIRAVIFLSYSKFIGRIRLCVVEYTESDINALLPQE